MSRECAECLRSSPAVQCAGCSLHSWLTREGLPVRSLDGSAKADPQAFAAWLLRSPDSLIARQRAYLAIVAVTP